MLVGAQHHLHHRADVRVVVLQCHYEKEVAECVAIASAVVINFGTFDSSFLPGIKLAAATCASTNKKWVLDPVAMSARQCACTLIVAVQDVPLTCLRPPLAPHCAGSPALPLTAHDLLRAGAHC